MQLRELLYRIGSEYDPRKGTSSDVEPQRLLRNAAKHIMQPLLPLGYTVQGRGGSGTAAVIPWIAIFDDDETSSAQHGMYLVYLFSPAYKTVSLSLIQGVTEVEGSVAERRKVLSDTAEAIRSRLRPEISGLDVAIHLGSKVPRAIDYERGSIIACTYLIDELPSQDVLSADLDRFLSLYQAGRYARQHAWEQHELDHAPEVTITRTTHQPAQFSPKSDSDVVRYLREQTMVTTRKHERLVKEFGTHLMSLGYEVATNVHPRDMTAQRGDIHWLIEAKTVMNEIDPVRDALSQLRYYRHFLYGADDDVRCLALFNRPISQAHIDFLASDGIAVAYCRAGIWEGTADLT